MKRFVCIKPCGGSAAGAFREGKRYDAYQSVGVMYVFGDDGKIHEFRTSEYSGEDSVPFFASHFESVARKKLEPSLETLKKASCVPAMDVKRLHQIEFGDVGFLDDQQIEENLRLMADEDPEKLKNILITWEQDENTYLLSLDCDYIMPRDNPLGFIAKHPYHTAVIGRIPKFDAKKLKDNQDIVLQAGRRIYWRFHIQFRCLKRSLSRK